MKGGIMNKVDREFMERQFQCWVDKMHDILIAKNKDYGVSNDPLANLRAVEMSGITIDHGIIIRMLDKVSRLCSFYEKGYLAVEDESINDTLIDLCNYAFLHHIARVEHYMGIEGNNYSYKDYFKGLEEDEEIGQRENETKKEKEDYKES